MFRFTQHGDSVFFFCFNNSGSRNLWAMRIVARRVQLPHWPHFSANGTDTISCHFMTQKRTNRQPTSNNANDEELRRRWRPKRSKLRQRGRRRRRRGCRNNLPQNSCDRFSHWIHMNVACTPTFFLSFFYLFLFFRMSEILFFVSIFFHIIMLQYLYENFNFQFSPLNFSNCLTLARWELPHPLAHWKRKGHIRTFLNCQEPIMDKFKKKKKEKRKERLTYERKGENLQLEVGRNFVFVHLFATITVWDFPLKISNNYLYTLFFNNIL